MLVVRNDHLVDIYALLIHTALKTLHSRHCIYIIHCNGNVFFFDNDLSLIDKLREKDYVLFLFRVMTGRYNAKNALK